MFLRKIILLFSLALSLSAYSFSYELLASFGKNESIQKYFLKNDSQRILVFFDDRVDLFDIYSKSLIKSTKRNYRYKIIHHATNPNNHLIAFKLEDESLEVWDLESGDVRFVMPKNNSIITAYALSNHGKSLAVVYEGKYYEVFDLESGKLLISLNGDYRVGSMPRLSFSPDDNFLVLNEFNGHYRSIKYTFVVGLKKDNFLKYSLESANRKIGFSPCGNNIVTISKDKKLHIIELQTGKILKVLAGHTSHIKNAQYSPCGNYLLTVTDDEDFWLWNIEEAKKAKFFTTSSIGRAVKFAKFSPNGKYVLVVRDGGKAELWNSQTMIKEKNYKHGEDIGNAAFNQDSSKVLLYKYSNKIKPDTIWDLTINLTSKVNDGKIFSACCGYILEHDYEKGLGIVSFNNQSKVMVKENAEEITTALEYKKLVSAYFTESEKKMISPPNYKRLEIKAAQSNLNRKIKPFLRTKLPFRLVGVAGMCFGLGYLSHELFSVRPV